MHPIQHSTNHITQERDMSIYFATHPNCTDPARVGGKAASLARCVLAGLPVPNFLVVDGDNVDRDEFEAYVG